ncbi:MAG TPA: glutaminyl-peptide cyclotransferase, partial [Bacteroidales bacterium]|nr:glutaminyl-peptide cyclotransferase [Bacteroidales bacterium]
ANVWTTNKIVKIDPATGHVVGKIDISPLREEAQRKYSHSSETNGIAYDAANNKIYVTGKLWPYIYQVEFSH